MPENLLDSYLIVNGVTLAKRAFYLPRAALDELLDGPPTIGEDRFIPGVAGAKPYPVVDGVHVVTIPLLIDGRYTSADGTHADYRQGILDNVAYLKANLGMGLATGDGTVAATWHQFSGANLTADVKVSPFRGSRYRAPHMIATTFDLSFPNGDFA